MIPVPRYPRGGLLLIGTGVCLLVTAMLGGIGIIPSVPGELNFVFIMAGLLAALVGILWTQAVSNETIEL